MTDPVISAASAVLAHTPGLARHGSKPSRELPRDPELESRFLGARHPRDLPERPWVGAAPNGEGRFAGAGELMPEEEFLGLMAAVDDFQLVRLGGPDADAAATRLGSHPL